MLEKLENLDALENSDLRNLYNCRIQYEKKSIDE
jgi:hypothetical protein